MKRARARACILYRRRAEAAHTRINDDDLSSWQFSLVPVCVYDWKPIFSFFAYPTQALQYSLLVSQHLFGSTRAGLSHSRPQERSRFSHSRPSLDEQNLGTVSSSIERIEQINSKTTSEKWTTSEIIYHRVQKRIERETEYRTTADTNETQ